MEKLLVTVEPIQYGGRGLTLVYLVSDHFWMKLLLACSIEKFPFVFTIWLSYRICLRPTWLLLVDLYSRRGNYHLVRQRVKPLLRLLAAAAGAVALQLLL